MELICQVTQKAASSAEPLDSYIMVEKEDVLEAIGSFVAAYIAELPQAQNLPPAELQLAITKAFKVLNESSLEQTVSNSTLRNLSNTI